MSTSLILLIIFKFPVHFSSLLSHPPFKMPSSSCTNTSLVHAGSFSLLQQLLNKGNPYYLYTSYGCNLYPALFIFNSINRIASWFKVHLNYTNTKTIFFTLLKPHKGDLLASFIKHIKFQNFNDFSYHLSQNI